MNDEKNIQMEKLLKRVYDLLNEGEGVKYLEVDGIKADKIMGEIKAMKIA